MLPFARRETRGWRAAPGVVVERSAVVRPRPDVGAAAPGPEQERAAHRAEGQTDRLPFFMAAYPSAYGMSLISA